MLTVRLPRRLTLPAWEYAARAWRDPSPGVDVDASENAVEAIPPKHAELHLDFAQVEFADFGALARALLLIDATVRGGRGVLVTMPASRLTGAEEARARTPPQDASPVASDARRHATRRARARREARAFMRHVGFLDALEAEHWPPGRVRIVEAETPADREEALDASVPQTPAPGDADAGDGAGDGGVDLLRPAPYRRRRIHPFQWLRAHHGERLWQSEEFLSTVTRLCDLGMSQADARAMSQTLLTELVANVAEHAASPGGFPPAVLVGATLLDGETFALRRSDLPPELGEVAEYAETSGSRVLRLVVADSGRGLVTGLASSRRGPDARSGAGETGHGPRPPAPTATDADADADAESMILRAFEGPPSADTRLDEAHHGPGGLWRVARVVHGFRGSVLVRTADAMAGLLFCGEEAGTEIAVGGLGRAPGTLVEIDLLTDLPGGSPGIEWGKGAGTTEGEPLRWVECGFDAEQGLTDQAVRRLAEAARLVRRDTRFGGVVATVPIGIAGHELVGAEVQDAIHKVLDRVGGISGSSAIALVFPDVERLFLDLAVSGFDVDTEHVVGGTGRTGASNPMLVIGASGRPVWCGGTRPLRGLLNMLLTAGEAVSLEYAQRFWRSGGEERSGGGAAPDDGAGFRSMLREQDRWLRVEGDRVGLRVSPLNALRAVEDAVHERLSDAIARCGPGVTSGRFRGPTLRLTDRWIDVERLLATTIGTHVAAFVLARKVERRLRIAPLSRGVVTARTAARALAVHLNKDLAFSGACRVTSGEFDLDGLPGGDHLLRDAHVVLCEDLISTENSVRRTAAALVAAHAEPAVVACVVDAREERGPIRILNRTIPVVALTDARIALNGAVTDVVDIDPVQLHPQRSTVRPSQPIPESDLLRWCLADPGILRLGHVERPRRKHFSAHLQFDRLLQHTENSERITTAVLDTIQRSFVDIGGGDGNAVFEAPIAIWYPGPRSDYAGALATAVQDGLTARRASGVTAVPIPRWPAGNRWTFPRDSGHDATGQTVLIIDWGALSATTLQQMIRLAAAGGAARIVAIAVLDQLDEQDADALEMWRAVRGVDSAHPRAPAERVGSALAGPPVSRPAEGPASRGRPGPRSVPVVVRFLGESSLTGLETLDCPMCTTQRRYGELNVEGTPRRLRRHAERLHRMLRPQSRDEICRHAAVDLFTVPVSGEDVVEYLRWRGLLRHAQHDTGRRHEVIDRLRALAAGSSDAGWSRANLMRLLAAEQQWLKLPPLRFQVARDLLAENCRTGLQRSATELSWLRAQALMVLAVAAPQQLVELLPRLLPVVLDETVLVDQMLLDCFRLLRRPPHDSPIEVGVLRDNLIRCRDQLEERPGELYEESSDHVRVIGQMIAIADDRLRPEPEDPQTAWDRLREDLRRAVMHHRLESDLLRVRDCVEELGEFPLAPGAARSAYGEWRGCVDRLKERALVNLPALRDVLAGAFVSDRLGMTEQQQLLRLVDSQATELRTLTDDLHHLLFGRRRPEDPSWRSRRHRVLEGIRWWHRVFLAAHLPEAADQPALLVELVGSAPTRPADRLSVLLAARPLQADVHDENGTGETLVFCPEKLLDEVIEHLLDNVHRHRITGAECRISALLAFADPHRVQIRVRNTGTRARTPPGQGIRSFDERLRPFGGSLAGRALTGEPWTFEAIITLPLWRGAGTGAGREDHSRADSG